MRIQHQILAVLLTVLATCGPARQVEPTPPPPERVPVETIGDLGDAKPLERVPERVPEEPSIRGGRDGGVSDAAGPCFYYRFVDEDQKKKKGGYTQTERDARGEDGHPPGLSVFKNLTPAEAQAMNQARAKDRKKNSVIMKIPCDKLPPNTASTPDRLNPPPAGNEKHEVINGTRAPENTRDGFNGTVSPQLAGAAEQEGTVATP